MLDPLTGKSWMLGSSDERSGSPTADVGARAVLIFEL